MPTVKELLAGVLGVDPAANAVEAKGRWYSWRDLAARIDALEALYDELSLPKGSRIALFLRNRIEPFAALFSILATERCLVTVNPLYPDAVLAADLAGLRTPAFVAESCEWQRPGLVEAVSAMGAVGIELTGDMATPARLVPGLDNMMPEKIAGAGLIRMAPDVIIEMLTSGTTGRPKRIPLKRSAFQHSFESAMAYEHSRDPHAAPRLRPGTTVMHTPISHIGGLWQAINTVSAGRKSCLIERFNVPEWHDAVKRHRPKISGAPPAALRMILDANLPKEDLSSLSGLISGTAPVDPALVEAFWQTYGIPILTSYGATEFAGAVAGWTLPDFRKYYPRKAGSVGRLQKGVEARIVDAETGAVLPLGEAGLLELKSKQMADPDAWCRTTDRAMLDDENFLWILGRIDNAIIRGGFKIHPDDVVKALEAHPAIREAAVVGIADARLGEVPAAALMLKSGASEPSQSDLVAFLRDRLLPYQIPAKMCFVDDVPRTASLKPALPALRSMLVEAEAP
jgi:acyl-CoA synthetase (AMP-forming)/AMP-acid ligase II